MLHRMQAATAQMPFVNTLLGAKSSAPIAAEIRPQTTSDAKQLHKLPSASAKQVISADLAGFANPKPYTNITYGCKSTSDNQNWGLQSNNPIRALCP